MLLILTKKTTNGAPQLRTAIATFLGGDEAEVLSKGAQEQLEIKDLDETTSKDDVLKNLKRVAGEEHGGTHTASMTLAATAAKKIPGKHGKIKIGWGNCRIRRVERPIKCFKGSYYGDLATKCTSTVDRSKLCAKCSATGHKASDCKEKPRCALCTEKANSDNCTHTSEDPQQMTMKILQLNLNHCEDAHDLLMQMMRELNLDFTMISEPYRYVGTQFWITDASRKAVIWACGMRPLQSTTSDGLHDGFVKAKFDGIHLYSCYAPPGLSIEEFMDSLDRLTEDVKKHFPVAIAGDFNAWAVDWGSKETNTRGQAVLKTMSALDVVLMNSGDEPTFKRGEATSIVDITFVSSTLAKGICSWRVVDVYTASDHRAILWEARTRQRVTMTPRKTNCIGWRVSSFDPSSYSIALNERPISGSNATKKADNIMKRLTEACDATMSMKHTTNLHPVYWWNDMVAVRRKECNTARRFAHRGRKKPNFEDLEMRYKKARRKLSKAIKSSKKQSWSELLNKVERDPWGRPYKVEMM
ncbi:uncharacterized protein LOC107043446 [Diachasma alloeum]|uniref:uncharacterized protein LOC107043446 n=1 Tax=Diachasma alloeum TaxID=454923 RepID=UPI0007381484|nr:uncharacterized protein LOC107043446 [Diachasma alloeum]